MGWTISVSVIRIHELYLLLNMFKFMNTKEYFPRRAINTPISAFTLLLVTVVTKVRIYTSKE